jgi:hypothetical protein
MHPVTVTASPTQLLSLVSAAEAALAVLAQAGGGLAAPGAFAMPPLPHAALASVPASEPPPAPLPHLPAPVPHRPAVSFQEAAHLSQAGGSSQPGSEAGGPPAHYASPGVGVSGRSLRACSFSKAWRSMAADWTTPLVDPSVATPAPVGPTPGASLSGDADGLERPAALAASRTTPGAAAGGSAAAGLGQSRLLEPHGAVAAPAGLQAGPPSPGQQPSHNLPLVDWSWSVGPRTVLPYLSGVGESRGGAPAEAGPVAPRPDGLSGGLASPYRGRPGSVLGGWGGSGPAPPSPGSTWLLVPTEAASAKPASGTASPVPPLRTPSTTTTPHMAKDVAAALAVTLQVASRLRSLSAQGTVAVLPGESSTAHSRALAALVPGSGGCGARGSAGRGGLPGTLGASREPPTLLRKGGLYFKAQAMPPLGPEPVTE